jgi:hypothetical protein
MPEAPGEDAAVEELAQFVDDEAREVGLARVVGGPVGEREEAFEVLIEERVQGRCARARGAGSG